MAERCNHVAAVMFRVKEAVSTGLTNPSCTSSVNEWLSCRKDIKPIKIEDVNFDRENFAQRGKMKDPLWPVQRKNSTR